MRILDEATANKVYDILVSICGAAEDDRQNFIHSTTGKDATAEYRFCGSLGFGGKFRPQKMSVDCYPEDGTPSRRLTIEQANTALSRL